jgi:hypothetical protein
MRYLILFAFITFGGSVCILLTRPTVADSTPQSPDTEVELRQLLKEIGDKYDCYFTMEIVLASTSNGISVRTVVLPQGHTAFSSGFEGKSLEEGLQWLKEFVPNLSFAFADPKGKVIHISDARLLQQKGYALNNVVEGLNFEGPVSDLPDAIGKKGIGVSSKKFGDTRELAVIDHITQVKVKARSGVVRDVLTDSLDFQQRGRVLWIAESELGPEKTVYVRYILKGLS